MAENLHRQKMAQTQEESTQETAAAQRMRSMRLSTAM